MVWEVCSTEAQPGNHMDGRTYKCVTQSLHGLVGWMGYMVGWMHNRAVVEGLHGQMGEHISFGQILWTAATA